MTPISLGEFLNLRLYYEDLRASHRALVTDNHTLITTYDIFKHFQNTNNIFMAQHRLIETDTYKPFDEPINTNLKFWQTGNNYFFNCLRFGFRHNVIQYQQANDYIKGVNNPSLYSSDYYKSLKSMDNISITNFLMANPIHIIQDNIVLHGIHRTCAMIGHLIQTQSYITMWNSDV